MTALSAAWRAVIAAGLFAILVAGRAEAQSPPPPAPGLSLIEVGVGVVWAGGASMGSAQANLTSSGGSNLTLFSTTSRLVAGSGLDLRLTLPLTRALSVEGSGTWRSATLETKTTGDLENAPSQTLTQPTSQFSIEAGVLWDLPRHGRVEPFARVGGGWMRQLSSDGALARDGLVASLGGGVKYWLREDASGLFKRLGLRAEAGALVRSGGIVLGSQKRFVSVAFSGAAIVGF